MVAGKGWAKLIKVIGIGAALLLGIILAAIVWAALAWAVIYPPAYVYRVLAWRESDNDDYRYHFPKRPLVATNPSPFPEALQMEAVAAAFERQEGIVDLAQFLADNDTQAFLVLQDGAGDAGGYDFAALGDHGQISYVAPSKNLVIVRHGTSYGDLGSDWSWTDMMYQFVSDWGE